MKTSEKPFVLIDGSSYLYRAFHALPPLATSNGEPTGAMYGVMNMIRKLLADYDPRYVAVVFDPKGRTFRDDLYPLYKANRTAMPDDLRRQIQPLHDLIKAMSIPLVVIEGVEADDVIGTLAVRAAEKGLNVVISSGDKDMTQIVDERIRVINTMSNTTLDRQGVIAKFGVSPERIVDYLALIGDSTDNIPGVAKVGPKTAAKWLNDYGSLDAIIARADQFSGKLGENLRESLGNLPLSRQLLTLKLDVELAFDIEDLQVKEPDREALLNLYKRFEFKGWLNELLTQHQEQHPTQVNYHTILIQDEFRQWMKCLKQAKVFAIEIAATNTTIDAEIVGIAFAIKPNEAIYIPLAHDYPGVPTQLARDEVLTALKDLLEDDTNTLISKNLKNDMSVLANYQIKVNTKLFDTMLESYVLDSTSSRHDLDSLTLKFLGKRNLFLEDIAGKASKQLSFNQIHLDQVTAYTCQNADMVLQLHQLLWSKITSNEDLQWVYSKIEIPLVPVLADMERIGVLIDPALLEKQSSDLAVRLETLEQKVYQLAGAKFNLSSPKQLQEILYEKMQLPILSRTPTGAASTAESVLQELSLSFPLPKLILEYRSLSKLKSTYTDALPRQINLNTGRIHTCYNQAVTSTGRLSSTEPNLQNIPIRFEEGRRVRQAFIAPPGYKIISADYSQIELRIMAHLSEDRGLLKAFSTNVDIHSATAIEVFNVRMDAITPEQRRHAKAINFGLIYGMSAFGLARSLGIDREMAQRYMNLYFERYPKVKLYMDATRDIAKQQGYVETLFGRRLYVTEINVSHLQRRRAAERAAINAPMQGTAADIIKIAMITLHTELLQLGIDAKMLMQVHDELVFEVAEQDVEQAIIQIRQAMTETVELSVPLVVEIHVGNNWDEAH